MVSRQWAIWNLGIRVVVDDKSHDYTQIPRRFGNLRRYRLVSTNVDMLLWREPEWPL